jgi:hypothetical protein
MNSPTMSGLLSAVRPGASFTVARAVKQSDGSFNVDRIAVRRAGVVPR